MAIAASVLDLIGATPLVALDRLTRGLNGRLLAKVEFFGPGLSRKDRVAKHVIEQARASGQLKLGQTVVELTSGSLGTGLAIVCRALGHPFVAVMSRGNSLERASMMRAFGAEVVLVDQAATSRPGRVTGHDLALVDQEARRIVAERDAFRVDQFNRLSARDAHALTTGPEIWAQSGGAVDFFCDFVGTGGALAGIGAYLREQKPSLRCYAVEPDSAPALSGRPITSEEHVIQGGGYALRTLPFVADAPLDGYLTVSDEAALEAVRRLALEEGLLAGPSTGANIAAALELLAGECAGMTGVVLLCDSGLKYVSTGLWST